jgi:hypothetical protein
MAVTANGQWNHAVPLDASNGEFAAPQYVDAYGAQESNRTGQKTIGKRPSEMGLHTEGEVPTKMRRPSVQSNHSLAPRKRSAQPLRQPIAADDHSAWIHRDKLAQIEIQEMAEAGMQFRAPPRSASAGPGANRRSSSRSASRTGLRKQASREQLQEPVEEPTGFEGLRRKRVSTIPAADEEEHDFNPMIDSEIRTPEEVAEEQQQFRQHMIRPSTSRIPISKASPVPVPSNVVGRDSPLPRSRAGSGAWSGQWDELQYSRRARSGSVGSQILLDDGVRTPSRPASSHLRGSPEDYTPHSRSPPKARMPNKDTPTSGVRKFSANGYNASSRPTSSSGGRQGFRSSTNGNRPPSSSGKPRPSTGQRPEGDAPWIATMYKPDPRLPPEQQMLPTHAKRLVQEQTARDGKNRNSQDISLHEGDPTKLSAFTPPLTPRDQYFQAPGSLLNPSRIPSPCKEDRSPSLHSNGNWPAGSSIGNRKSDNGSIRPGTSGGYRITPTISTPPALSVRASAASQHPDIASTKINTTPRIPDYDEKEDVKEKKGCMSCVIM